MIAFAVGLMWASASSAAPDRSGIWWDPQGSGSGVFTLDQGSVLIPAWYTYDADGKAIWFVVSGAVPKPDGSYTGTMLVTHDSPYLGPPTGQAALEEVGTAEFHFVDSDALLLRVRRPSGEIVERAFERFRWPGARDVVCETVEATADGIDNASGVWWEPARPGWGLQVNQIDDLAAVTWYTHGSDRRPIWMVSLGHRQDDGSFTGELFQGTQGAPFDADVEPAQPARLVGTMRFDVADATRATFTYSLDGNTRTHAVERARIGDRAAVCRTVQLTDAADIAIDPEAVGTRDCMPLLFPGDRWLHHSFSYDETRSEWSEPVELPFLVREWPAWMGHDVVAVETGDIEREDAVSIVVDGMIRQTDEGQLVLGEESYYNGALAWTIVNTPPRISPRPIHEGRWVSYSFERDMEFAVEEHTHRSRYLGRETIEVPAGRFEDACKFERYQDTRVTLSGQISNSSVHWVEWVHPDGGEVRFDIIPNGESGIYRRELVEVELRNASE